MRKRMLAAVLLAVASLGVGVAPATAAVTAASTVTGRAPADVRILPGARLSENGTVLTVRVRLSCQPGTLWEGFINATQGAALARGDLPLNCDGRRHVETVKLYHFPSTPVFVRGRVSISAVIMDENTLEIYARDTRTVRVC